MNKILPHLLVAFFVFGLINLCAANLTYAQSSAQSTLPLSDAIEALAQHYEINIVYDADQLKGKTVKDWTASNQTIDKDLENLLKPFNFDFKKLKDNTYIIKKSKKRNPISAPKLSDKQPAKPAAKTLTVTGSIYDEDSYEPLIGVNIIVKGTSKGTVTDYNGAFTIDVEEGQILVCSYLGFITKDIEVKEANLGKIYMETNAKQLDEVVVIGYGTQKRSDLTGSLSSVSEKELKQLPSSSLDQALQGRAAGVQVTQNSGAPGGGISVRIRGIGSTLTAEPLYVIDGIPVVNDNAGTSTSFTELDGGGQNPSALNTINPNDIESIEILKDASATAIYGSRGANGVVLITTKRGKKGRSTISVENYVGLQELGKEIPVMNLREYADYYGSVSSAEIDEFERPELLGEGTNWQREVFRKAWMQNYQLTLSGGSEKTNFAMSAGYHLKEGIVVGSDFNRFSGKMNIDHTFSDKLKVGNSLLVSRTKENITFNDNSNGVIYTALLMVPSAPVRNADGTYAGPQEEITLSFDNPVARALETNDVNRKTRLLSNIYLEYKMFPWLSYRTEFGNDILYSNHNTFFPSFERGNFFGKSGVRRSLNNSQFWITKHLLNFDNKIGEKSNLKTLLGFEAQEGKYEWLSAGRENLPNNELQQINLGDAGQQQNGGGAGHFSLVSYFGRFNYSFDDRFLVTGTVRADGSSRFGPNNRFGIFSSGALAWRVSNEEFLKDIEVIDNLKLRAGLGQVGNQEIGLYSFTENLRGFPVVGGDALITGYGPDNIPNPDVKWETTISTNFGFDLGLYKNRIEITADVYRKEALDMLLPVILPSTAGSLNAPFVNVGEIVNTGLEITLKTQNTVGEFSWRTAVIFTKNRNEVIDLGETGNLVGVIQRIPVTRTVEGMPISQFYGYVTDGIFQDQAEVAESPFQQNDTRAGDIKFKDLNEDGVINDADQTFIGSPIPDFTLNISNNIEYKGFDFNLFVQGVSGNEVLNLVRRDVEGMAGLSNQVVAVANRFTPLSPSTELPRATGIDPNNNRRISDRFIEDGSFIRIKNMTLGYTIKNKKNRETGFKNFRVYASTQNLKTWTNFSGYDPEVGSYNQNPLINGVENGRYPIARSYTFGLNVNF